MKLKQSVFSYLTLSYILDCYDTILSKCELLRKEYIKFKNKMKNSLSKYN